MENHHHYPHKKEKNIIKHFQLHMLFPVVPSCSKNIKHSTSSSVKSSSCSQEQWRRVQPKAEPDEFRVTIRDVAEISSMETKRAAPIKGGHGKWIIYSWFANW